MWLRRGRLEAPARFSLDCWLGLGANLGSEDRHCVVLKRPRWLVSPNYLLGGVAYVHCIINPILQEAPCVLKVWRGVLHHHQLCSVVDASQHCPPCIPVKLQTNPWGVSLPSVLGERRWVGLSPRTSSGTPPPLFLYLLGLRPTTCAPGRS